MCNRQTDHRAVRQIDRTLDKTLSESTTAYNDTTILILNGSSDNLCGRRRITIYKDDDLTREEGSTAIGSIFRARHSPTLCIDNEVALLQELLGNVDCSLQISAAILLQIEDEISHSLLTQLIQALQEFLMGRSTEVTNTDIADARANHIGGINRLDGNLITDNSKLQHILDTLTNDAQVDLRAFRATQTLHDLLLCHLDTSDGSIVYQNNAVACQDAHFLRRAIRNRLDHEQGILNHIELYTDPLEITIQRLVEVLYFLRREIAGMRVKLIQHTSDGILHQFLLIDTIHIEIGNGHLCKLQFAQ